MKKYTRILSVILLFCGVCFIAFADRGGFVKKNKTQLNINTTGNLKNSIAFNLKSGIEYRGSRLLSTSRIGNVMINESIVSYKKGNTIYIVPYKQRIMIPEYSQSEGYKLIIRSKK